MLYKNNLFIFFNEDLFEEMTIDFDLYSVYEHANIDQEHKSFDDISCEESYNDNDFENDNDNVDYDAYITDMSSDSDDDYSDKNVICDNSIKNNFCIDTNLNDDLKKKLPIKKKKLPNNLMYIDEISDEFFENLEFFYFYFDNINKEIKYLTYKFFLFEVMFLTKKIKFNFFKKFNFSKNLIFQNKIIFFLNKSIFESACSYNQLINYKNNFIKKNYLIKKKLKFLSFKDKKNNVNLSLKKLINKLYKNKFFKNKQIRSIKLLSNQTNNNFFFLPKITEILKKKKTNFKKTNFKKKRKIFKYNVISKNFHNYNFLKNSPTSFNYFMIKLINFKNYYTNYSNFKFNLNYVFIILNNFFFNEKPKFFWKTNIKYKIYLNKEKISKDILKINSLNLYNYNIKIKKNYIVKKKIKIDTDKLYNFTMHLITIKDNSYFYKSNWNYSLSNKWDNLYLDSYIGEFKKNLNFFKNNIYYNNYFPLYNLNKQKKSYLIKILDLKKIPTYSNFYFYYMIYFLENFLGSKVWLKLNTTSAITHDYKTLFKKLVNKNKYEQIQFGKSLYLIELYEILYLTLKNRDLTLFLIWFKKIMEKNDIRKHKKLVKIIHNTLRKNIYFLTLTDTAGIFFDIRGKLGVSGNAKKRHYAFTVGERSFTKKSLKLVFSQTTVRTDTGVLGVSMYIAY